MYEDNGPDVGLDIMLGALVGALNGAAATADAYHRARMSQHLAAYAVEEDLHHQARLTHIAREYNIDPDPVLDRYFEYRAAGYDVGLAMGQTRADLRAELEG